MTDERYVSPTQAANIIGVSAKRVVQLCGDGRLLFVRTPLGRLIVRASVEDYVLGRQPR